MPCNSKLRNRAPGSRTCRCSRLQRFTQCSRPLFLIWREVGDTSSDQVRDLRQDRSFRQLQRRRLAISNLRCQDSQCGPLDVLERYTKRLRSYLWQSVEGFPWLNRSCIKSRIQASIDPIVSHLPKSHILESLL